MTKFNQYLNEQRLLIDKLQEVCTDLPVTISEFRQIHYDGGMRMEFFPERNVYVTVELWINEAGLGGKIFRLQFGDYKYYTEYKLTELKEALEGKNATITKIHQKSKVLTKPVVSFI